MKIIKGLEISDPISIKNDLISTLIKNQSNSNLLDYIHKTYKKPLSIYAKLADQNSYIRKILNIKVFEHLSLESLIRNAKQKQVLMPTSYTQALDTKLMDLYRGCIIGTNSLIEPGAKLKRTFICNGCKIGKNVQISNCTLLQNTVVEENCRIVDSVIAPNNIIRAGSTLKTCQLAFGCHVEKNSVLDNEIVIPYQ